MYILVNSTSLHYWNTKCKFKYLGFLNFIASLSIRVCINIRIQSLVIQTCIEKASCNIKYYTIHIWYTKKYINIAITNMIQRPSNWYSLGMVITGDIVPGQWVLLIAHFFATGWFDTYFLEIIFDDPTNYRFWTRPQYGSSLELWILSTSIDTYTKWQMSISYGKTMKL